QAHRLTLEQADSWSTAFALSILGNLTLATGDLRRSKELQHESLRLRQLIDDRVGIARCLDGLSWVASAQGSLRRAARLFGAADALRERVGSAPHPLWQAAHARYRCEIRTRLSASAFQTEVALGAELDLSQVLAYALAEEPSVAAACPAAIPGGLS